MNTGGWVAILLFLAVAGVGVYDLIAVFSDGKLSSVSYWVQKWSGMYPFIPFSAGFVIGHLFFSTTVRYGAGQ